MILCEKVEKMPALVFFVKKWTVLGSNNYQNNLLFPVSYKKKNRKILSFAWLKMTLKFFENLITPLFIDLVSKLFIDYEITRSFLVKNDGIQ